MSKFQKKRSGAKPEISTASLPDIIFMLLFFFMVTTVMRDSTLMVKVTYPEATELNKLEQKSLVNYIYIGRPNDKDAYGSAPRIQLGDKFSNEKDIPLFLEKHKLKVAEGDHPKIITSLRVDGSVTMGIIQDVKEELRKAGQLKLNYSAKRRAEQ